MRSTKKIVEHKKFNSGETYIGVELTDEAGEIVVLEVRRKEDAGEFGWIPNHEAFPTTAP